MEETANGTFGTESSQTVAFKMGRPSNFKEVNMQCPQIRSIVVNRYYTIRNTIKKTQISEKSQKNYKNCNQETNHNQSVFL
jgi:hypothetical protein